MDSNEYDELCEYLQYQKYPEHFGNCKNLKRNFRRKALKFRVDEKNVLYQKVQFPNGEFFLQYPLKSQVPDILKLYHDSHHPGINATLTNIRREYYWIGMCDEVKLYVKSCDICQKLADVNTNQNRLLHPIPPPEKPWQHIGIDLVCDLPISKEGYLHLLVATCYLSKYAIARPLKSKRSRDVIDQLRDIYLTFGTPEIIQHDQGPEFRSKEFQQFHQTLRIDNRSTAAYHPQSNGLVEAHNKILKRKIDKFRSNMDVEWPERIYEACLAANTHLKVAIKTTPFRLMFGRDCNPAYLFQGSNAQDSNSEDEAVIEPETQESIFDPSIDANEWIEDLDSCRKSEWEAARANIIQDQARQKKIYDAKVQRNRSNIEESEDVLVRNVRKDKKLPGTKTQPKYLGPYEVHKVTKSHVFVTDNLRKTKKVPFHLTKKYFQRETQGYKTSTLPVITNQISKKPKQSTSHKQLSKSQKLPAQPSKFPKLSTKHLESTSYQYTSAQCGNGNIGAMLDIWESPTNQPHLSEEQQFEILNEIKPKLLTALHEESFLSELHKQLDEKSKYMRFNDLIAFHPENPFDYTFKENAAYFVSQCYNEYLVSRQIDIDISDTHMRDYPLTVLLPVILESIANSQLMYIDSDTEEPVLNLEVLPTSTLGKKCITYTPFSMFDDLCPVWQGEFNGILHLNTCSIDNIISLLSLHRGKIEGAMDFAGISENPEVKLCFELIRDLKFDELRDCIAKLLNIQVTYYVLVKQYNFHGSECTFIKLLRKFDISNDVYSSTLQCYSCCAMFTITPQLGSLPSVTSNLQTSINNRIIPKKSKNCQSDDSYLEQISGYFLTVPSLFIIELGHLPEILSKHEDIDEIIYISDKAETSLCYKLAGFTVSMGNHFYLIIRLNDMWYKYNDMLHLRLQNGRKVYVWEN